MTKQFEDQLVLQLSAEEAASFDESLAQADRGEFATDEQVHAIWAKHGPVKLRIMGDFTTAEIEGGRRLFAGAWDFISAAGGLDSVPPMGAPEIAFAGRSNVGKSSLINALTGRRALARTSNTPGRTQQLIFFGGSGRLVLTDMPGYGYAAVAKSKVAAWTELIHDYLRGRATLARVYVLIDARHGLKDADDTILDTLGKAAVSYEIVLTKCDQVEEAALAERVEAVKAAVRKRPAAFPDLIATSARTGVGIDLLRAAVARLLAERSARTDDMRGRQT